MNTRWESLPKAAEASFTLCWISLFRSQSASAIRHRRQLIVPRVRRSTFGACAFAIAGPTVWNSLPDSLRDPAVGPDQFRRDLKTHLFEWHCVSFSALAVFSRNALYKSTFYLLTYTMLFISVAYAVMRCTYVRLSRWCINNSEFI